MRYYRALKDLSNGYRRWELVPASAFLPDKVPILLERGAIGAVQGPPLYKLPGWKVRSEKLAKIGVTTVHGFLEADVEQLAAAAEVHIETIEKWQGQVIKWLAPVPAQALEQATRGRRRG